MMRNVPVKLNADVVPHIFDCQKNRTVTHTVDHRSAYQKRQRQAIIEDLNQPSTSKMSRNEDLSFNIETDAKNVHIIPENQVSKCSKKIQVNMAPKMLSKETQCNRKYCPSKLPENTSDISSSSSDSDTSATGSFEVTSDFSCYSETIVTEKENVEKRVVFVIERNPKLYLGIPAPSLFLIEMICSKCQIGKIEVYMTLKKIRLNLPFSVLADDFGTSKTTVSMTIQKCLPKMAQFFEPFIQWKSLSDVQKCLPIPFRARYKKVQCIIDCFEISIQKPSNPVLQSLSWSEYKKGNTMKYLVACTPDGLISFVSNGFGGRTSDKMIVEESGFLDLLEDGAHIMADRGFKHLDEILLTKNNFMVRPPSVSSKEKSSKEEVKTAKKIASLRIHVERVIARIREFDILKPHACVNLNLVKSLDDIVVIACGVINIQNYLIK